MKPLSSSPWLGHPGPMERSDIAGLAHFKKLPAIRCWSILLQFFLFSTLARAQSLHFSGVLGNSGEQGKTLVRFASKPAPGLGIAYDPATGSLFDRAGDGTLNRYAVDGRQLATYPLGSGSTKNDVITLLGGDLILLVDNKLLSLPTTAPTGTAPTALPAKVTAISSGQREDWLAAANGTEVFFMNRHGETRPASATLTEKPDAIEIGPDGGTFASFKGKMQRIDADAPEGQRGPWESPGDRPQWLDGAWWGSAGHGTLRRFNTDFNPDPGVVLGGSSGWFIGYVPGNHELNTGRGLAHLGGNLYAVSGESGILHLLEWQPVDQRFTILRRIGAVAECSALAIDSKGRVWHDTGVWDWTDGPDKPVHHSVPGATGGLRGIVMTADDVMAGPGNRWGKPSLYHGDLDGPAKIDAKITYPADAVASALITWKEQPCIFIAGPTGKGTVTQIAPDGKSGHKMAELDLKLTGLTSLAVFGETLYAAAGGEIIEFTRSGETYAEEKRWNSWNGATPDKLGGKIQLAADQTHLWVTDAQLHRVLVFDPASRLPVATFGVRDQAGDDLAKLNAPGAIAANHHRAVFHDAGNQRLIRLEFRP